jgi:hypothetical protein
VRSHLMFLLRLAEPTAEKLGPPSPRVP